MTPEDVNALFEKNDATLSAIKASLTRIEAKHADERQDLLRIVTGLIEADPRFRYAIAMMLD